MRKVDLSPDAHIVSLPTEIREQYQKLDTLITDIFTVQCSSPNAPVRSRCTAQHATCRCPNWLPASANTSTMTARGSTGSSSRPASRIRAWSIVDASSSIRGLRKG